MSEPLLITSPEAAKLLAISERKLRQMTKAGEIPSVQLGRSIRYSPERLKEWLQSAQAVQVTGFAKSRC